MSELLTLGRVRLLADSGEPASAGVQPKRIALLAYLVLATERGPIRRDSLLALFWPELDDEEARRALRQALHYLRRVIGDDVFATSGDQIEVRSGAVRCDAAAVDQLIEAGRHADALALYHGDFFDGFHVDDVSAEYEEWVDRTRARLRRRAAGAAWSASDAAATRGDSATAVELARRACELEPDQEAGWRRLMSLHQKLGDRAGALRAYEELTTRLQREFETEPAPETTALAERIRAAKEPSMVVDEAPAEAVHAAGLPPPVVQIRQRSRRSGIVVGLLAMMAVVVALTAYLREGAADSDPSLISTGSMSARDRLILADFANLVGDSTLAVAVTEAFRVDLSQSPVVRVLTPPQVNGALARMERAPGAPLTDSLAREIALREGAKAIVTGAIAKIGNAYTVSVQLIARRFR